MEYYLIYIYKEVKAIYYECHKKNTHTDYLRTTGKCRIQHDSHAACMFSTLIFPSCFMSQVITHNCNKQDYINHSQSFFHFCLLPPVGLKPSRIDL